MNREICSSCEDNEVEDGEMHCAACEAYHAEQERYWRPLWEGERAAGLLNREEDSR